EEETKTWQEVLSEDPSYPKNVYLSAYVSTEWKPGKVGTARMGTKYTDENGYPLEANTVNAFGPPEGGGARSGGEGLTCPIGINGEAVWQFNPDYVIIDGQGDDFITFTKTWAWGGAADGLCCELARVEVSQDGEIWYELISSEITYDEDPDPTQSNNNYIYRNVSGLHGNAPSWANFRKDMQAEELIDNAGIEYWEDKEGFTISRYFEADEDYLGGTRFDLGDFHKKDHPEDPWPVDGKMKYLKIIDDNTILDGQNYARDWALGANLMAAMGINTEASE
ncbi:MAG: hypothetical protein B6241_15335, partial [Spirochaetaceae bacterium 4572_59]